MSKDLGIRRGIVINNEDPEYRGRCKIFVPGIYPNEFAKTPENLPWAEPAMSLFGGGWKSSSGSKNQKVKAKFEETGVCSVPHAGMNGDGAQVWVFFDSNDLRRPVYFAVAQTGDGWFSKHNNQHVIVSDNVKLIIDEFDNYTAVKNKSSNVSDKLAKEVSTRPSEDLKNDISNIGGVSEVQSIYDAAGGSSAVFDFMNSAGGSVGLQQLSDTCSDGLNSLSTFISKSGGSSSLQKLLDSSETYENIQDALDGKNTVGGNKAKQAILDSGFGSIEEFQTQLSQVGGLSGLKSITDKFGGTDEFFDSLDSIGSVDGLSSLASLESKLGGSEALKEWNDGFKNGASDVDNMISGKTAEDKLQEAQQQSQKKEDETLTKTTTYTQDADGFAMFKSVTQENRKTRLKIQVEAGKNVAVDLSVKGDVNMKIDGNLYREITGNIYDTILGDHWIYRKKGLFVVQDGNEQRMISGNKILKVSQQSTKIVGGGEKNVLDGNLDLNFGDAVINIISKGLSIDTSNFLSLHSQKIKVEADNDLSVDSRKDISVTSTDHMMFAASLFSVDSGNAEITGRNEANIKSFGAVVVNGCAGIKIVARDQRTVPQYAQQSGLEIYGDMMSVCSAYSTNLVLGGTVREFIGVSATPAVITRTIFATDTTTMVGNKVTTLTGTDTLTQVGALTETITGAVTQTVTGAVAITASIGIALTGTASGVTVTGSGGSVVFSGAKTTITDTSAGTGGSGVVAIVG